MQISKPQSPHFRFLTEADFQQGISIRPSEQKLGEVLRKVNDWEHLEDQLKQSTVTYVIIGIAEDIGVRANWGIAGTSTAWPAFLQSFLNLSCNSFLDANTLLLAGYFDFADLLPQVTPAKPRKLTEVEAWRKLVPQIDEEVANFVSWISGYTKIPVVIGGGHNNAFPLIKGTAQGLSRSGLSADRKINVLNADAHADFRPVEGRHSGNPFRYAREEGWLNKYGVMGVMENYLTESVFQELSKDPLSLLFTYEAIFLRGQFSFPQVLERMKIFVEGQYTGVELDVDSIANVLSSASSPSGISVLQARQYITAAARLSRVAYVHICEGAAVLEDGRTFPAIGKLLSILVVDFMKSHQAAKRAVQ